MLRPIQHPIYAPGQVWLAPTPLNPQGYTVTILHLEHDPRAGSLAHVRVEGVRIPISGLPGGYGDTLGHAPFTLEALGRSGLYNSGQSVHLTNADLEGYRTWRSAFERGESGVFSLNVQDAVDQVAESMAAINA